MCTMHYGVFLCAQHYLYTHDFQVIAALLESNFDPLLPTLIITECVLVYMERAHSLNIIRELGSLLTDAVWITYDMLNPLDRFGITMQRNMDAAGFRVPGILSSVVAENE